LIPYTQGTNGGANTCSATYKVFFAIGVADELGAEGGAFVTAAKGTTARAIYVSLQLLTGGAEVADTGAEVTTLTEQLQSIIEMAEEESAGKPITPPPGHPAF
jgi:hypothetical protein